MLSTQILLQVQILGRRECEPLVQEGAICFIDFYLESLKYEQTFHGGLGDICLNTPGVIGNATIV